LGKWIVFAVAVAAALFAFLVYRRKSAAAAGASRTTGAPAGATAGGALATLTAPARPDDTGAARAAYGQAAVAAMDPAKRDALVTSAFGSYVGPTSYDWTKLAAPVIPVTASLPVVGYGTVAPTKPATQALPTTYNPPTVYGGFSSFDVGVGQSFYVAPKTTTTTAPAPAPAPTVTTAPRLTFATRL
jgi:hypothetical protein